MTKAPFFQDVPFAVLLVRLALGQNLDSHLSLGSDTHSNRDQGSAEEIRKTWLGPKVLSARPTTCYLVNLRIT